MAQMGKSTKELYDVSTHFGFGENWADYALHITDEKINQAQRDLQRLLPDGVQGKTFLDIGCGSGLHALAALKSGAALVSAIDFDPNSVKTTDAVLKQYWGGENTRVDWGNILDLDTLDFLPEKYFDIVYSWGVLHHTGDMKSAIKNATGFVKPKGTFVLAIYKKTPLCTFWKKEKFFYTHAPGFVRGICNYIYAGLYCLGLISTGRNPVSYIRQYPQNRGMRFMTDIKDWLGGYPYESASPQEIEGLMNNLGFTLRCSYNTTPAAARGLFGSGCAEYVFAKN